MPQQKLEFPDTPRTSLFNSREPQESTPLLLVDVRHTLPSKENIVLIITFLQLSEPLVTPNSLMKVSLSRF
jgi:hypothetical protein